MELGRRSLIVGTLAITATACGRNSSDSSAPIGSQQPSNGSAGDNQTGAESSGGAGFTQVVRRFPTTVLTPGRVRLPVSLGNVEGVMSTGPNQLSGRILNEGGDVIVDGLTATVRSKGLANPHWSFVATLDEAGVYTLEVEGRAALAVAFQINEASAVRVPQVGRPLPPFDTPTLTTPNGVDPVCTRKPGCGLHDITLSAALAAGKPIVYLVGTPAYCQTGVCGPMLDFVLAGRQRVGERVSFVHAEIYTDDSLGKVTPSVEAYSLDFEPVIFFADAAGTITERLDAVADATEIDEALALIAV